PSDFRRRENSRHVVFRPLWRDEDENLVAVQVGGVNPEPEPVELPHAPKASQAFAHSRSREGDLAPQRLVALPTVLVKGSQQSEVFRIHLWVRSLCLPFKIPQIESET